MLRRESTGYLRPKELEAALEAFQKLKVKRERLDPEREHILESETQTLGEKLTDLERYMEILLRNHYDVAYEVFELKRKVQHAEAAIRVKERINPRASEYARKEVEEDEDLRKKVGELEQQIAELELSKEKNPISISNAEDFSVFLSDAESSLRQANSEGKKFDKGMLYCLKLVLHGVQHVSALFSNIRVGQKMAPTVEQLREMSDSNSFGMDDVLMLLEERDAECDRLSLLVDSLVKQNESLEDKLKGLEKSPFYYELEKELEKGDGVSMEYVIDAPKIPEEVGDEETHSLSALSWKAKHRVVETKCGMLEADLRLMKDKLSRSNAAKDVFAKELEHRTLEALYNEVQGGYSIRSEKIVVPEKGFFSSVASGATVSTELSRHKSEERLVELRNDILNAENEEEAVLGHQDVVQGRLLKGYVEEGIVDVKKLLVLFTENLNKSKAVCDEAGVEFTGVDEVAKMTPEEFEEWRKSLLGMRQMMARQFESVESTYATLVRRLEDGYGRLRGAAIGKHQKGSGKFVML